MSIAIRWPVASASHNFCFFSSSTGYTRCEQSLCSRILFIHSCFSSSVIPAHSASRICANSLRFFLLSIISSQSSLHVLTCTCLRLLLNVLVSILWFAFHPPLFQPLFLFQLLLQALFLLLIYPVHSRVHKWVVCTVVIKELIVLHRSIRWIPAPPASVTIRKYTSSSQRWSNTGMN